MDIDWPTLTLEMINFIVLVWLLQRLLYRPVLAVIEQRRKEVDEVRSQAETVQAEAETLRSHYEQRLSQWQQEKQGLRDQWQSTLREERQQALAELNEELTNEKQRQAVLIEREREETARRDQETALRLAANFASRICERLASAELTERLLAMLIEDLPANTTIKSANMTALTGNSQLEVRIVSAHPLQDAQRQQLQSALKRTGVTATAWTFSEDKTLVAGLRIHVGPYVLQANLADELKFFAEAASNAGAPA